MGEQAVCIDTMTGHPLSQKIKELWIEINKPKKETLPTWEK